MQAALMLRAKSRERRKQRLKRGVKQELPTNVATRSIAPFPRYPPASWCAAGRAAWQEAAAVSVGAGGSGAGGAARRCSVLGDHPGARRDQKGKWHRNNRVRDASYGSSSESDGEGDGTSGEPWGVARLLYAGLGTLAVGLVVYFVGTGDKGFKTPALRLVGPSLCIAGLACCLLRIAFCIFAKPCCKRRTNYKESRRLSNCAEGEEMPLASSGRGVGPAQCSPARRLDTSSCDVSSLSSGEEDERLRRYRISSGRPPQTTSSHSTVHQNSLPSSSQLAPSAAQKPPRTSPISPITAQPSFTFSNVPSTSALPPSNARSNVASTPTSSNVPSLPGSSECPQVSCSLPVPCNVPVSCNAPVSINVPVSCTVPVSGNEPVLCNMPVSSTASSLHQTGHRRLPPRNVSFANGPEGELVLSPAQLRS